jgi:hypothetical protein
MIRKNADGFGVNIWQDSKSNTWAYSWFCPYDEGRGSRDGLKSEAEAILLCDSSIFSHKRSCSYKWPKPEEK